MVSSHALISKVKLLPCKEESSNSQVPTFIHRKDMLLWFFCTRTHSLSLKLLPHRRQVFLKLNCSLCYCCHCDLGQLFVCKRSFFLNRLRLKDPFPSYCRKVRTPNPCCTFSETCYSFNIEADTVNFGEKKSVTKINMIMLLT